VMTSPAGIIYLLHFTQPYKHARHYIGWADDLEERIWQHACGRGARLTAVVVATGIHFELARICEGTRRTERAIKNAGGAVRYCPLCTPRPRNGMWGPVPDGFIPGRFPISWKDEISHGQH
jgi:predicted GIY-YIG superfamily endonuclease